MRSEGALYKDSKSKIPTSTRLVSLNLKDTIKHKTSNIPDGEEEAAEAGGNFVKIWDKYE